MTQDTSKQFAPGPWHTEFVGQVLRVFSADGHSHCPVGGKNYIEQRANADLIAAAPQMLEVLLAIRDRFNTDDRMGGLGDAVIDAIAAATGEAVQA